MKKEISAIPLLRCLLPLSLSFWKSRLVFCALILFSACKGGEGSKSSPSIPGSLSLVTPGSSPGLDSTPTVNVDGVIIGNTVKLFSDSACSVEIGTAIATGTSVNVTVSSPLSVSAYTFYANASHDSITSPCSSVSVSYTLASCPAGFISVPHNSSVGTHSDFCVMKYEAKALNIDTSVIDSDGCNEIGCSTANWGLANHIPKSSATGYPWRRINPNNASSECGSLNTEGSTHYDLISNLEWMTIARNAESLESNWSDDTVGYGQMARGWAANDIYTPWINTAPAPSAEPSCIYNTGANQCASTGDHLYKRTLILSNGEEIWDFSGNVWEWVDWNSSTLGFDLGPTTCLASWVQFPMLLSDPCYTQGNLPANDVLPATSNGSSTEALGRFYGGSGGAARRGGYWDYGTASGAFALDLLRSLVHTRTDGGFRCVYRL